MPGAQRIDPRTQIVGFDRELTASPQTNEHDPVFPVEGMTFGVAVMSENAPHGGERHLGGDEVLYLIEGRAKLVFTDDPEPDVDLKSGDVVIVPKGLWHRVEILERCHFVYLTPGPNNEVRPRSPASDR
jgi:mannose-6-phosphate isomerase-like protein (cupin superfamily)